MRQRPKPRRPARRQAPVPPGEASDAFKLSGLRAVEALFRRDPDAIRRLYLDRATAPGAGAMCRYLAERRRAYAVKDDAELARIAGTLHHGGIVAVIAARAPRLPGRGEIDAWAAARQPVLVLDGVGNPHNFGAIVRTAAFLGIEQVVLSERAEQALPSPAAYRVAEGGFEHVVLWRPPAIAGFLRDLGRRHRILAASPRGTSLAGLKRGDRPVALVLGTEESGLSPAVEKLAAELVAIPGADGVESLNVSVAAGILMYELLRR
ncbi:MAG: RNA methyltransferase [Alphaproteobacteria bacterium]|nr:RNA methyltransferase [Alphaproteobacteria bacterium]